MRPINSPDLPTCCAEKSVRIDQKSWRLLGPDIYPGAFQHPLCHGTSTQPPFLRPLLQVSPLPSAPPPYASNTFPNFIPYPAEHCQPILPHSQSHAPDPSNPSMMPLFTCPGNIGHAWSAFPCTVTSRSPPSCPRTHSCASTYDPKYRSQFHSSPGWPVDAHIRRASIRRFTLQQHPPQPRGVSPPPDGFGTRVAGAEDKHKWFRVHIFNRWLRVRNNTRHPRIHWRIEAGKHPWPGNRCASSRDEKRASLLRQSPREPGIAIWSNPHILFPLQGHRRQISATPSLESPPASLGKAGDPHHRLPTPAASHWKSSVSFRRNRRSSYQSGSASVICA